MPDFTIDHACAELKIPKQAYITILTKALDQTAQDLDILQNAVSAGDCDTIQAVSHRIKGDYANLRVNCISDAAKHINDHIRSDNKMSDGLKDECSELFSVFSSFKRNISSFLS